MHSLASTLDGLERDLIRGRARWIAELNEFFRDYVFMDTTFDLYALGRTRSRGLFLSRFFAATALPDYSVSLFCLGYEDGSDLSSDEVRRKAEAVCRISEKKGLKWAWLIILTTGKLSAAVVSFAQRYDKRELGLAVGSVSTGQSVFSNSQLGRSLKRRIGIQKLVEMSQHGKGD